MKNCSIITYNEAYEKSFIEAYKEVYGDEPYNERFNDEDVIKVIERTEISLLIDSEGFLIGFVGGRPIEKYFQSHSKEEKKLKSIIDGKIKTYYVAELGVRKQKQKAGFGKFLFSEFLIKQKAKGYQRFILVTAEKNNKAQLLYERTGFKKLKDKNQNIVSREVSNMRTDGTTTPDNRVYFIKE